MRIAFISDVHGNAVALEAVLADIKEKNIDEVIFLGDLCYRGPEPKRSLEIIRELNVRAIKGNADEWMVRGIKPGEVPEKFIEKMNQEREWGLSQLDQDDLSYLNHLPNELSFTAENVSIHAYHATPTSLFEVVLPDFNNEQLDEKLLVKKEADLFIYAHIHLPYVRYINGKCLLNIGSVGLPFDGMPKSSYAIVDITGHRFSVTIERVDYDRDRVIKQYQEGHYPNVELMSNVIRDGVSPFK